MSGAPFFIVGSARSGTTLLRVILNAHSEVAVPPESRFVTELWTGSDEVDPEDFIERLALHRQFQGWNLDPALVRKELGNGDHIRYSVAIEAVYVAYMRAHNKTRWGDKTPRYVLKLPFLAEMFPRAHFVHLIRDGRNVALSYAKVPFGPKTAPRAAAVWSERIMTGVREGRPLGSERYRELRYEDLVADPERRTRELCEFLELNFEPSMLDYTEKVEEMVFAKASTYNPHVFEKPTAGVRSWETEMSRTQVRLFEAVAGETLEMFGYPRRHPAPRLTTKVAASLGRLGAPVGRLRRKA
ncbi:MAG: sulfotransferase family protein [Actinomycetota bacterium]